MPDTKKKKSTALPPDVDKLSAAQEAASRKQGRANQIRVAKEGAKSEKLAQAGFSLSFEPSKFKSLLSKVNPQARDAILQFVKTRADSPREIEALAEQWLRKFTKDDPEWAEVLMGKGGSPDQLNKAVKQFRMVAEGARIKPEAKGVAGDKLDAAEEAAKVPAKKGAQPIPAQALPSPKAATTKTPQISKSPKAAPVPAPTGAPTPAGTPKPEAAAVEKSKKISLLDTLDEAWSTKKNSVAATIARKIRAKKPLTGAELRTLQGLTKGNPDLAKSVQAQADARARNSRTGQKPGTKTAAPNLVDTSLGKGKELVDKGKTAIEKAGGSKGILGKALKSIGLPLGAFMLGSRAFGNIKGVHEINKQRVPMAEDILAGNMQAEIMARKRARLAYQDPMAFKMLKDLVSGNQNQAQLTPSELLFQMGGAGPKAPPVSEIDDLLEAMGA